MTPWRTRNRPPARRRRTTAIAAALVALAAVTGCTGVPQRAAHRGAVTTPSATTPNAASGAARTKVTTVLPWDRNGLAAGYRVAGESTGTCMPSGTTSRADAYRCFDSADQVLDPCLASPYADPVRQVACPVSPRKVHLVRVDGGLPASSQGTAPQQGDFWMATLADGTRCRSSTGAGPPPREGLEVRMYCRDGTLWGPLESAAPLWTVRRSDSDTGPLTTTSLKEVFR